MSDSSWDSSAFPSDSASSQSIGDRSVSRMRRLSVSVPAVLYEECVPLVKGLDRPSWGQLIVWTCLDRSDEVVAEVTKALEAERDGRTVRGPNRVAASTVRIGPRVTPKEVGVIEVAHECCELMHGTAITRTALLLAALRVARQHPEDYEPS